MIKRISKLIEYYEMDLDAKKGALRFYSLGSRVDRVDYLEGCILQLEKIVKDLRRVQVELLELRVKELENE
jgi:hypothetical protein